MRPHRILLESASLVGATLVLLLFLLLPQPGSPSLYWSTLSDASLALKGQGGPSDIAQDIIGFRALLRQQDSYPILASGVRELGLKWDVGHASAHPPVAFLLVAPVALLPWNWASAAWAWLMVALLVLSFRCYGVSWKASLGLTPLALLWPPVATSLGQMTVIWLLGLAAGYRFCRSRPLSSGIGVALASLTKLFPGLLVLAFLMKRQWHAVLGFVSVWVVSLFVLVSLNPGAIARYVEVNQSTAPAMMWRPDNSSLLLNSYRSGGWAAFLLVLMLFLILFANRGRLRGPEPLSSSILWRLLSYFSVALLPVMWIYSVTPLLPVIINLITRKKLSTMLIGCLCIAIPVVVPAWGTDSVLPLVALNLLVGIGLLVDALPFRVLTAVTLGEMARPLTRRESAPKG